MTIAMVGISPDGFAPPSPLQGADVSNEILDLICLQAFAVSRHFAFPAADDPGDRIVTLRLHIRGPEVPDVIRFADGSLAFSVRAVAARAFCLVKGFSSALPFGRERQDCERRAKKKAQDPLAHTSRGSIHISSRKDVAQNLERLSQTLQPRIP
jgi:hypothetical protein